mmetsp:Transcript_105947/g.284902  ORF Transcript_105947/g.284902 Transcript_105947/m.284902 type:complete len:251 (-) Transcript_105947:76-828(-)
MEVVVQAGAGPFGRAAQPEVQLRQRKVAEELRPQPPGPPQQRQDVRRGQGSRATIVLLGQRLRRQVDKFASRGQLLADCTQGRRAPLASIRLAEGDGSRGTTLGYDRGLRRRPLGHGRGALAAGPRPASGEAAETQELGERAVGRRRHIQDHRPPCKDEPLKKIGWFEACQRDTLNVGKRCSIAPDWSPVGLRRSEWAVASIATSQTQGRCSAANASLPLAPLRVLWQHAGSAAQGACTALSGAVTSGHG